MFLEIAVMKFAPMKFGLMEIHIRQGPPVTLMPPTFSDLPTALCFQKGTGHNYIPFPYGDLDFVPTPCQSQKPKPNEQSILDTNKNSRNSRIQESRKNSIIPERLTPLLFSPSLFPPLTISATSRSQSKVSTPRKEISFKTLKLELW